MVEAADSVLVLGANGQLGRCLAELSWPDRDAVTFWGRDDLDLTQLARIAPTLSKLRPRLVINAAAYTAVDRCESEVEAAELVNHYAVAALAEATATLGIDLIHFSTDYVFDGAAEGWYTETDAPNPLGVYGKTKLAGERSALANPRSLVLRTSWIYSHHGHNFVKTIRRLASERAVSGEPLSVVDDQRGCPTSALDLARSVQSLALNRQRPTGLFHLAGPDEATWWQLATEVVRLAGLADAVPVRPIPTTEYPTPAPRPANSRLDSSALTDTTGAELMPWRQALAEISTLLDRPSADQHLLSAQVNRRTP